MMCSGKVIRKSIESMRLYAQVSYLYDEIEGIVFSSLLSGFHLDSRDISSKQHAIQIFWKDLSTYDSPLSQPPGDWIVWRLVIVLLQSWRPTPPRLAIVENYSYPCNSGLYPAISSALVFLNISNLHVCSLVVRRSQECEVFVVRHLTDTISWARLGLLLDEMLARSRGD